MEEIDNRFLGCYNCGIYTGPVTIQQVEKAIEEHRSANNGHTMINRQDNNEFLSREMRLVKLSEFVKTRKA